MQSGKRSNGGQLEQSSTTQEQSESQVLELARLSEELLKSDMYNQLYRYRMDKNLYDHETTEQPHQNRREALYQQRMAIMEGPQILQQWVLRGQEILRERNAEEDPAKLDQRRLDEQGFGLENVEGYVN